MTEILGRGWKLGIKVEARVEPMVTGGPLSSIQVVFNIEGRDMRVTIERFCWCWLPGMIPN